MTFVLTEKDRTWFVRLWGSVDAAHQTHQKYCVTNHHGPSYIKRSNDLVTAQTLFTAYLTPHAL